jgi:glycosyltransferase involved in cell wall biosynthesis
MNTVLQVTPRYLPESGGIETHVREVTSRLVAAGVDVSVLTTDRSGWLPATQEMDGVPVRRVPAWPPRRDYYFAPGMWRAIRTARQDIVHFQGVHTLVPVLGMLACLNAGKKYMVTLHTGGHSSSARHRLRGLQWRLLGPLLRRAIWVIGVSRFEAELFTAAAGLPAARVRVVRNGGGLPAPVGAPEEESDAATPVVVSIGRLERYKGHHRLIEAMPRILESVPGTRALILGTGPYEMELRALADRLGVAGSVEFRFVPGGDRSVLAGILQRAALVVLLSDYEAHPVAVMEAVSLGRPILVTMNSGLTELVEEGLCHGVPDKPSTEEVASAVVARLTTPNAPFAQRLPTWDECAASLGEIYTNLGTPTTAAATEAALETDAATPRQPARGAA